VVYQVIVDRFAPAANLDAKRALYPAPRVMRRWDEVPVANSGLAPGTQITRHELDFWGGDLQSLRSRLDHVQALGADVLYLNPIHLGFTNHKLKATIIYNWPLKPPLKKGEQVATLRVTTASEASSEVPLYVAEDVAAAGTIRRGLDSILCLATGWLP
jgi:hypothetical protein